MQEEYSPNPSQPGGHSIEGAGGYLYAYVYVCVGMGMGMRMRICMRMLTRTRGRTRGRVRRVERVVSWHVLHGMMRLLGRRGHAD